MILLDPDNDPAWPGERTDGSDPTTAFPVPFSIGVGLVLVAWTILAQLVAAVVFTTAGADFDNPVTSRLLVVASQITTIVGILVGLRATGRLSWRLLGPVRPSAKDLVQGLVAGLIGYGLVLTWILAWSLVFGEPPPTEQSLLDGVGQSTSVIVLTFLAAVGLAPLVEELVFRGVLFQAARRQAGVMAGVLISAFVFTAVHMELYPPLGTFQPVAVVGLFLLGSWLAFVFHRTGALVVAVVAHAVFNAVNLSLAIWAP